MEIPWEGNEKAAFSHKSFFAPVTFANLFQKSAAPQMSKWQRSKRPFSWPRDTNAIALAKGIVTETTKSYRRRNWATLGALGVLIVLALGLGLGLGLKKHSSSANLPLPSNTAVFTGDITYYRTGLGACGVTSTDTDSIVAVSHIIFDAEMVDDNPNHDTLRGKKIRITRLNNGKNASVEVTVVDRCVGCATKDLDLSITMFTKLAAQALGRTKASWAWLN
ncbi:RlpA-like double-psi beta-barrel-protein domain-containing protein-containing protein [Calycina marina]|uniref:RlpA-like double-psi beta-barrel-protein domain-containing protein-containing protein n=1 Tax=Calycina marina TaxID=1763456 RepID=A0A9P7Z913_9HELO|nr:RlpA-like double-psi beta-barrel-protein domain-containing protein-containing protein [Calycina marina]